MSHRQRALAALATALLLATGAPALAVDPPYPTTADEAIAVYEAETAGWAEGPVSLLMLDQERDLWRRLRTENQRQAFRRWFWDRRDPDLRDDTNPFLGEFYGRVAEANRRFREAGIFRGWKSDRGLTWVLLGPPDGIRSNLGPAWEAQEWTYYTVARDRAFDADHGELRIQFVKPHPGGAHEAWDPFAGAGVWPRSVLDAFGFTRESFLENPQLEPPAELGEATI